jgi:hypothetical protein
MLPLLEKHASVSDIAINPLQLSHGFIAGRILSVSLTSLNHFSGDSN